MKVGNRIKELRNKRGLTQEALAAALGVTPQSVSKWECEVNFPDVSLLPDIAVFFGVGVLMMLGLGALDGKGEESKFDTIRHKIGRRNYGHAAVFFGTACLFMGTPKECEELCDDLWHRGQQVHMDMLNGEETLEIL
jgi:transcriptional regulator with XRE-family HTH domain